MTRDEPCTGSEGVVGYGPSDTWPQYDVTWRNGVTAGEGTIKDLCDGDGRSDLDDGQYHPRGWTALRTSVFVRRLS